MQTGKAVLALCNYFAASGISPLEAHKEIKWGFKVLEKAPHKLKSIDTIKLTDINVTIEVQNISPKKVIKILKNSEYNYYKITTISGETYEYQDGYTKPNDNVSEDVIELVRLFTQD